MFDLLQYIRTNFPRGAGSQNVRCLERILLLAAETDPGVGYIQGMHDIACVIFFVFLQDLVAGLLCSYCVLLPMSELPHDGYF